MRIGLVDDFPVQALAELRRIGIELEQLPVAGRQNSAADGRSAFNHGTFIIAVTAGVAVSLALAMVRVLTGISIMWFLLPGYIAALALTLFVPKIFTAIAFDSGGVASGTMTATFLLSFAMGACEIIGGTDRIVTDAFGVVALVAMTPLITIQILGLAYNLKLKRREAEPEPQAAYGDDDIIEL